MAVLSTQWYGNLCTIVTATKDYATGHWSTWSLVRATRETVRQVRETFDVRTSVAVTAVLLIATTGIHSASIKIADTSVAYQLYVNGKAVGVVQNLSSTQSLIKSYEDQLQGSITWSPVRLTAPKLLDKSALALAIQNQTRTVVAGAAIVIDGKQVAVVPDETTASAVMKQVEQKLASPGGKLDSLQVNQSVTIQPTQVDQKQLVDDQSAVAILLRGTQQPKPYVVSRGDSLWSIAADHHIQLSDLQSMNPAISDQNAIKEGQQIVVSKTTPILTVQSVEETDETVAIPYDTTYQDDANLDEGQTKVLQDGVNGSKQQNVQITKQNGQVVKTDVLSETVIQNKTDQIVARGTRPTALPYASGSWITPTVNYYVSSPFGEWRGNEYHPGIDLAAPTGTPIYAANSGTVIFASYDTGGYGNCVRISHGSGIITVYGHMSQILTSVGKVVAKGEQIGKVGMTGDATGPHLHYEVRSNGVAVNPAPYMQ
ncbi:MAG: hypothetical protein JWN30_2567 [Bacilli bacterium]|nr:hypothetical protein [Bacilli bacterium]